MGEWSFAEMAGHLLGWRRRTLARLVAFSQGEPDPADPWPAELKEDDGDSIHGTDAINAWIHEHYAHRSPAQLVGDYDASYDRLVEILESMPDARLTDPTAIPWLEAPLVAVDFTGHLHDEHVPSVRVWLESNRNEGGR